MGSRFGEGESQLEVDRRMVRPSASRAFAASLSVCPTCARCSVRAGTAAACSKWHWPVIPMPGKARSSTGSPEPTCSATTSSSPRWTPPPASSSCPRAARSLSPTPSASPKLPTTLVEAFKSTLDEITGADLVLHVIDASSPEFEGQIEAVCEVLDQIGAQSIPTIAAFNKCDLLDAETLAGLKGSYPSARSCPLAPARA